MFKKNWKSRSAVSPVIATILMVAITVVLAAVLYVMVMGMGGTGGDTAPTMNVTKNSADRRVVVSIDSPTAVTSFKLAGEDVFAVATGEAAGNYTTGVDFLTFVDAGNDGKINTGDYFAYTAAVASGTYDVLWVNGDTSQVVATFTL